MMRSVGSAPLSDAPARASVPGASGAVRSIVTASAVEAVLVLPARSTSLAVRLWVPAPRPLLVSVNRPSLPAVPVPTRVAPS